MPEYLTTAPVVATHSLEEARDAVARVYLPHELAKHTGVDKVAFTGSTATGAKVAQAAVGNINKITLELGGKSPQVVFADADLEAAANGLVAGVFAATGQTCMAGSRLIVHESVKDELIAKVAERANTIVQGDPHRRRHRDGAGRQPAAVREGARLPPGRTRRGLDDRGRR